MQKFYLIILCSILVCACNSKKQHASLLNDSLSVTHAGGFDINYFDDYKEVVVYNPWNKNEIMQRYYLVADSKVSVPVNGQKIKVPLKSLGATSCTHIEFLFLLNDSRSITGICSPELVYNEDIRNRFHEGKIINLGEAFNLNFEKVLFLKPDGLMVSGFNHNNENERRFVQAGIPVIYNNEWTETTLLGRAEWIKFVSVFYNKEKIADSIFSVIKNNYDSISALAVNTGKKPTILSGSNFKGTWYMPGGKSYMAQMYADAGGDYFYKNDLATNSLPLSFEMVLKNFQMAEYWLGCGFNTIKELIASDERHMLFESAKNRNVYNFNNRVTSTGGNDFWEGGVAHPDWILSDVIKILHPELLPDYQLVYARKLK